MSQSAPGFFNTNQVTPAQMYNGSFRSRAFDPEAEKHELRSRHVLYRMFLFFKDTVIVIMEAYSFASSIQGTINTDIIVVQDPAYKDSLESVKENVHTMNVMIIVCTFFMGLTELIYLYVMYCQKTQYLCYEKFEGEQARIQKKWCKRILEGFSMITSLTVLILSAQVSKELGKGYAQETQLASKRSINALGISFGLEVGIFIISWLFDSDWARESYEDLKSMSKYTEAVMPRS